jgi:hypothetical protein
VNNDHFVLTFEQRPLFLSPKGGRYTQVWLYLKLFLQKYDRSIWIVYVDNFPEKRYFKIEIEVEWFQNNKIPTYHP